MILDRMSTRARRCRALPLAALLLSTPLAGAPTLAGDCASADACTSTQEIRQQFLQQRLDRTLSADPDGEQISGRFSGSLWDPGANGAAPLNVAPAGEDTATLKTSLSKWGSFVSREDARIIEETKKLAPKDLKLPAPVTVQDRRLDVWTQTRIEGTSTSDLTRRGYTSYVGADYALGRNVLFGAMTQMEDIEQSSAAWGSSASGRAFLAGPYMAMHLSPNLTLDAKAAWGQGSGGIGDGSGLETERHLAEARLKGTWSWNRWRLSPSASISQLSEVSTNVPGTQVEVERVTVAPEIARPIALGDGRTIEPSMHYRSSLDLDTAGALLQSEAALETLGASSTVGAGLAISKPNEYTIRATADVEGLGKDVDPGLRSRLQVNIPLD